MFKVTASILIVISLLAVGARYSSQPLHNHPNQPASQEDRKHKRHNKERQHEDLTAALKEKLSNQVTRSIAFDEAEFNVILLASLEINENGKKLLSVSDAVKAFLHKDKIELTATINLDKLEKVEPHARKAVERFDKIFPFLKQSRFVLTVYGTPIIRAGKLAIKDDFHIKVGAIPITNQSLRSLGVKVEHANKTELPLKHLSLQSLKLIEDQIELTVVPNF